MRHIFIVIYTKNVFEQRRNKSSLTRMVIKRSRVNHSRATQTHSPNGGRSLWWIHSCNMKKLFLSHHKYCIKVFYIMKNPFSTRWKILFLQDENYLFLDNKKISSTRWKIFFPKDERNLFLDNKNIFSAMKNIFSATWNIFSAQLNFFTRWKYSSHHEKYFLQNENIFFNYKK